MPINQPQHMPPRQVFNLEVRGGKRKLVRTGELDSPGVTMAKDKLGMRELIPGGDIVVLPGDYPHTSEYHLPRQDA